jgi:hypothetical protein
VAFLQAIAMIEVQSWKHTYPTVAQVKAAHVDTCVAWLEHLPPAETDVQHTVQRRLRQRIDEGIKQQSPAAFESIEKIRNLMKKAGLKMPGNFYSPE